MSYSFTTITQLSESTFLSHVTLGPFLTFEMRTETHDLSKFTSVWIFEKVFIYFYADFARFFSNHVDNF